MRTKIVKLFENEIYHDEEATEYYETYYNNVKNFDLFDESKLTTEEEEIGDPGEDDEKAKLKRSLMPRNTVHVKGVFKLPGSNNIESPLHVENRQMRIVKKLESYQKLNRVEMPENIGSNHDKSDSKSQSSRTITEQDNSELMSNQKKTEPSAVKKLTPRFSATKL